MVNIILTTNNINKNRPKPIRKRLPRAHKHTTNDKPYGLKNGNIGRNKREKDQYSKDIGRENQVNIKNEVEKGK
ncbi:MAG: hypothetical protein Q8874_01130 [Sweet potato little leaf phytoplasma]|nr:hypothetical protein [Sweet potato little leaf phytoplasma]